MEIKDWWDADAVMMIRELQSKLHDAEYSVQCWQQMTKNAQLVSDEVCKLNAELQAQLSERIGVETALRNALEARVIFHCPKCNTETKLPNPLAHLDCLGCGANIISEERPRPTLREVPK